MAFGQNEMLSKFWLLIGLICVSIFWGGIPVELVLFAILIFQLVTLRQRELGISLILGSTFIWGIYFQSIGFEGGGGLFLLAGGIVLIPYCMTKSFAKGLAFLGVILLCMFMDVLVRDHPTGMTKLSLTGINAFASATAFYVLFAGQSVIKTRALAEVFILYSLSLFCLVLNINDIPGPTGLLDFEWMREQTKTYGEWAMVGEDEFSVSYHHPGFFALLALALYNVENKSQGRLGGMLLYLITMLIILHTGARQNILAWVVLTLVTFWKGKWKIPVAVMFLSVMATAVFVLSSKMESLGALFSQRNTVEGLYEASGRAIHAAKAWEYFLSSPFVGIGYGFHDYGGDGRWAHNIFLEVLAEFGLFGFSILLVIIGFRFFKAPEMKKNRGMILVLIPYLVRAFVSESLALNIAVLTIIIFYHRTEHERAEL